MYILGIYNAHNSTAAIVRDGVVIACVSEERFTKVKNQYGFPKNAIDYCLKQAGIDSSDLDLVVIPFKYGAPQHSLREKSSDVKLTLSMSIYKVVNVVRRVWGEIAYRYPQLMPVGKFFFRAASIAFEKIHMSSEKQFVADYLKISKKKVITVDHHLTHAFSGYYCSPLNGKKALVMTLDGEGDFKCATVSTFEKGEHKLLASSDREHSIGYIYQRLTQVLGMKANEHEYKVMGLAPYAKGEEINKIYNRIKDIVYLDPSNQLVFKSKFNTLDTDKFLERELVRVRFDILAATFQKLVEEKAVEWVRFAIKKTKINRLVLSGGVF
ncbi:MAG: carbamoyltransferase N-terminal domain-containing protein, partial [Patescibacteria group bacterium]